VAIIWLIIGLIGYQCQKKTDPAKLPKIFHVNWFRKGKDGKFLWPGFGENSRVLKWIFERTENKDVAQESPIGYLPKAGALDVSGLNVTQSDMNELFHIDKESWKAEVAKYEQYISIYGKKVPEGIQKELNDLKGRLAK